MISNHYCNSSLLCTSIKSPLSCFYRAENIWTVLGWQFRYKIRLQRLQWKSQKLDVSCWTKYQNGFAASLNCIVLTAVDDNHVVRCLCLVSLVDLDNAAYIRHSLVTLLLARFQFSHCVIVWVVYSLKRDAVRPWLPNQWNDGKHLQTNWP